MTLPDAFKNLPDPRVERHKRHSLEDIFLLTICAFICGADRWTAVEDFGHAKADWFNTFLALPNGIPSHDHLGGVFARLGPEAFRQCCVDWMDAVAEVTRGEVVAIDGKTLRRSYDRCQKTIAGAIRAQNTDYVLALKGNQGTLHEELKRFFGRSLERNFHGYPVDTCHTVDADHGRIASRRCWTLSAIDWLEGRPAWPDLNSIGMVKSQREVGYKTTTERRYFISSLAGNAAQLVHAVRTHWAIENRLHWTLDAAFRENDCRVRKDHGPDNRAMLLAYTAPS